MMKMDGRGSAEYQIWKKRDIMVIIRFDFKSLRDEIRNSLLLFKPKATENVKAIFENQ